MRYRLHSLLIILALGPPVLAFTFVGFRDGEAAGMGVVAWLLFSTVASLSWYFAPRPRHFVQVFVPKVEWRAAIRRCVHDPLFESSMRMMSKLQFAVALWVGAIVALGTYFS
jgi:hypothetical protein